MIEVNYTLTASKFSQGMLSASQQAGKGLWRLRLYLCVALPLALLTPVFRKDFDWHIYLDIRMVFVGVLFLIFLSLPLLTLRGMRKQFVKCGSLFEDVTLRLDEDGYHVQQSDKAHADIQWSAFTAWQETPGLVLLYRQAAAFILPKRVFATWQLDELRRLCTAHIPAKP
jgi:hypothetical protein